MRPILRKALKGKKTPIKSALLDQRVISGIGNIYACEALFRAHISPKRLAANISGDGRPLVHAIKQVLKDAIKAGGSSLRDYAHTDGELGEFQHRFAVYDREAAPCLHDALDRAGAVVSGRASPRDHRRRNDAGNRQARHRRCA